MISKNFFDNHTDNAVHRSSILIVGGSGGIGRAIALKAVTTYERVVIISRTNNSKLVAKGIECLRHNINTAGVATQVLSDINPRTLVLCAAKGLYETPNKIDEGKVIRTTMTTFTSSLIWLIAALSLMPRGGKIGWISSLTGRIPNEMWAVYSASKAGVEHFIKCVRTTFLQRSLSLTVCYPGCVATQFHANSGSSIPKDAIQPSEIAGPLLDAVEQRLSVWSAPMDREIINKLDSISEIASASYEGYLK